MKLTTLASILLGLGILAACSGSLSPKNPSGNQSVTLSSDTIAAHFSTPTELPHSSGKLILVNKHGKISTVDTGGFQANSIVNHSGGIHLADINDEIRVDASGTVRQERGAEYDLGEWAGSVGAHVIRVFNVGTDTADSNKYIFGVSAWTGNPSDKPILGELDGDIQTAGACDDVAYFIVDDWNTQGGANRRLLGLHVVDDQIIVEHVASIVGPPEADTTWGGLFCKDGELITHSDGRSEDGESITYVGTIHPSNGAEDWTQYDIALPESDGYSYEIIGLIDNEFVANIPSGGDVLAMDITTGAVRVAATVDPGAYLVRAGVTGKQIVLWEHFDRADHRIRMVDPTGGSETLDLEVPDLASDLRDWDMSINSDPVAVIAR